MGIFGRSQARSAPVHVAAEEIRRWLVREVADRLHIPENDVDTNASLLDYGLDSLQATAISGRLERLLKRRLSPAILWDHPTIEELTIYLSDTPPPTAEAP